MATIGAAALGIWMDVVAEAEDDFNRWYVQQHFPERLGVPGFLRGRRYLAVRGTPRYFILYETEGVEVLRSSAYLARLNDPTDWTRRVLPTMRNVVRNAYRLLHAVGAGEGPASVALRIDPAPGQEEELRQRYERRVLEEMCQVPGVISASLYQMEQVATGVVTEERKLVGTMGSAPPFLCFCELRDPSVVDHPTWGTLVAPDGSARKDVARDVTGDTYRLLHSLCRPTA